MENTTQVTYSFYPHWYPYPYPNYPTWPYEYWPWTYYYPYEDYTPPKPWKFCPYCGKKLDQHICG